MATNPLDPLGLFERRPNPGVAKRELPPILEDILLEASRKISDAVSYFEVQRTDLLEVDPNVRKFVEDLKQMNIELTRKRAWIATYRIPPFLS